MTAPPEKKSPQPWNQNLDDSSTVMNKVYMDKDSTDKIVSARIKTEHIHTYIDAIKNNLKGSNTTEFKENKDSVTVDINDKKVHGKLKVTLYPTTGRILFQGGKPNLLQEKAELILLWFTAEKGSNCDEPKKTGMNSKSDGHLSINYTFPSESISDLKFHDATDADFKSRCDTTQSTSSDSVTELKYRSTNLRINMLENSNKVEQAQLKGLKQELEKKNASLFEHKQTEKILQQLLTDKFRAEAHLEIKIKLLEDENYALKVQLDDYKNQSKETVKSIKLPNGSDENSDIPINRNQEEQNEAPEKQTKGNSTEEIQSSNQQIHNISKIPSIETNVSANMTPLEIRIMSLEKILEKILPTIEEKVNTSAPPNLVDKVDWTSQVAAQRNNIIESTIGLQSVKQPPAGSFGSKKPPMVCKFHIQGECNNRQTCNFAHPYPHSVRDNTTPKSLICIKFNSADGCTRDMCSFVHKKRLNTFCPFYYRTQCMMGEQCNRIHSLKRRPLENDNNQQVPRRTGDRLEAPSNDVVTLLKQHFDKLELNMMKQHNPILNQPNPFNNYSYQQPPIFNTLPVHTPLAQGIPRSQTPYQVNHTSHPPLMPTSMANTTEESTPIQPSSFQYYNPTHTNNTSVQPPNNYQN